MLLGNCAIVSNMSAYLSALKSCSVTSRHPTQDFICIPLQSYKI